MCSFDAAMSSSSERKYSDGSVYVGEWSSDGQKHGRGRLAYVDKTEYRGQFDRGLHSSSGVLVIPDKYVPHSVSHFNQSINQKELTWSMFMK